jgi:predicted nucleic acid-binding protein
MTARTFVDTNVWVYAVDGADPEKQARARAMVAPSPDTDLVVSSQVLSEFYVTVTRKLERPIVQDDARRMLEQLRRLPVVAIDSNHVLDAVDGSRSWGISYWDALIVVAAMTAGCPRILSEDLADGGSYGNVRVENPFRGPHRVSEELVGAGYGVREGRLRRWDDAELLDELGRYEREATDAGMKRNAVHSYWDYARRFLAWRTGDYRPRGAADDGRPVASGRVSADVLADQTGAYARAIEAAGREQATIDTYHRHAMFFVRWLRGEFKPGRRLR